MTTDNDQSPRAGDGMPADPPLPDCLLGVGGSFSKGDVRSLLADNNDRWRAALAAAPAAAPAWDDNGVATNLAAAAMDASEWLALIERLHAAGRWPFSEADSLAKLQGCRASLAPQLAAFQAHTAAPAWQPIEKAPKDGRDLLLWESGSSVPVVASWRDGRRPGWHASQEHYNTDGDACVVDTLWQDGITHWMPLPAAPEIQCAATEGGAA